MDILGDVTGIELVKVLVQVSSHIIASCVSRAPLFLCAKVPPDKSEGKTWGKEEIIAFGSCQSSSRVFACLESILTHSTFKHIIN